MTVLASITPTLQKCLDDPAFIDRLYSNLRRTHPEFRVICDRMDSSEFAFATRKCITTAMLCASGALKTSLMSTRLEQCDAEVWGQRDLFPLWIDCLIRTVDSLHPLSEDARLGWRKAMQNCVNKR